MVNYAHRLPCLLVIFYLHVWIPCLSSAFLRAGVEHWTAPRPRKRGCKHAARSPLPSTSMVAAVAKVTTREGDAERKETTERKIMVCRLEDLKVGFYNIIPENCTHFICFGLWRTSTASPSRSTHEYRFGCNATCPDFSLISCFWAAC